MGIETQSERLGTVYRSALRRIDESRAFWNAIGSGQPVTITSSEVLSKDWPPPTPDEACREATAVLDRSRDFRAAHGLP